MTDIAKAIATAFPSLPLDISGGNTAETVAVTNRDGGPIPSLTEIQQAIANYSSPPTKDWKAAHSAIHAGLRSQSSDCPFCQVRTWAATDTALKIANLEFMLSFSQPANDRFGAVQAALLNLWATLTADQQTALNKNAIEAWDAAHNLGLEKPWTQP